MELNHSLLLKPFGIVIVSYKTTDKTIKYINNQLMKIQLPFKIAVVNNSFLPSDDDLFLKSLDACIVSNNDIIDKNKDIFIINSDENLGFARGNNLGAEFLTKEFRPEFLLFSNNDVEIISENIIEQLIIKANSDPTIGIIGPKMFNHKGDNVSPRYDRVSPFRYALWHIFYPIRRSKILSNFTKKIKSPGTLELLKREQMIEGFCYWVAGSFMMIKTSVFIKIKGFDPGTFLYGEEKIIAERIKTIGYGTYYFPEVSVLNEGEYTTSKYLKDKDKKKLIFESDIYYYKNYFKLNILLRSLLSLSRFIYISIYNRFFK